MLVQRPLAKRVVAPSKTFVAAAVAILAASVLTLTASASPRIASKQERAQAVLAQVRELDGQVEAAAERWNAATIRLSGITQELRSTRRHFARARADHRLAQAHAGARLRTLYVNGDQGSVVEVIMGARSLGDVIDLLDATSRVAEQDARIVRQLRATRAAIAAHERTLANAQTVQATLVRERAGEKAAIEARLAERERLLVSIQDEVARLQAAERARQAELRRQALARLAAEQSQQTATAQTSATDAPGVTPAPSIGDFAPEVAPAEAQPPAELPAPSSAGRPDVVAIAMRYLGIPYKWGGASPAAGFDCSGLTMYIYAQIGISLPHLAAAQYQLGTPVEEDELLPGDLVFFNNLGHEGMYIGGGQFIHAPQTGDVVKISSLSESWYASRYVGARRVG